ncbi:MAG: hypothetical protein RI897_4626, partial [Verrucomicrobiota bacterium]
LIEGETLEIGFKLVRDVLLITNLRIIDIDKQGATGKKMRIQSIYLDSLCGISCETAGFGMDDSEMTLQYITPPYRKAHNTTVSASKFEFPKKFEILSLYTKFESIVHANLLRLNS